jgi:hypothetical protein
MMLVGSTGHSPVIRRPWDMVLLRIELDLFVVILLFILLDLLLYFIGEAYNDKGISLGLRHLQGDILIPFP